MPNINEWISREKILGDDKGAGDTLKRVTESLGIKPCGGCQKRQEALNKMFPYNKKE